MSIHIYIYLRRYITYKISIDVKDMLLPKKKREPTT